ncbi:GNAT family N-acetyltransferase [Streptomyces sp. NPDC002889]|uniref:GNAT family N-acetyltransferase n=1 Tax=Streptomyces sp. NPDC002889 TaxID=3364669 RepID=UPI0036B21D4E
MTTDDCEAVATVRVRGWQFAYAGMMPQSYLDAMSVAEDAEKRRDFFERGRGRVTNVVAVRAGAVVGWGCIGPSRDEGATAEQGELYAIYVLPEQVSTGVGRALMAQLNRRAEADGFRSMRLWVLKENDRARRFYERAGFLPDGAEEPYDVEGVAVPEVRYVRQLGGQGLPGRADYSAGTQPPELWS